MADQDSNPTSSPSTPDDRDASADDRGRTSSAHDRTADERDELAARRDARAEVRDATVGHVDIDAATDRNAARRDRSSAKGDRTHRLARELDAMAVGSRGLDLRALTGGIGERSAVLRADLAERLDHLGVSLDPSLNDGATGDADISAGDARVRTVVVTAGEDRQIAHEVSMLLGGEPATH